MLRQVRLFLVLTVICLFGLGGVASAQLTDRQSEYYQDWISTADRAESVIQANRASNAALENLRSEINEYREDFNKARSANTDRIQTLESQLKALGAKPADGETEPEDIAKLRAHLEDQLNSLRVPRIISEEAFSRANGLISEIDRIIRDRQKRELLKRGPSPFNPVYWGPAWVDVKEATRSLINETVENMRTAVVHERIRERGLGIVVLLAMSVVLLLFGRSWSEKGGAYLRSLGGRGSGVWTFVVSLLRILLPWLGVVLLVSAVVLTGVLGLRGTHCWSRTFPIGLRLYSTLIGSADRSI